MKLIVVTVILCTTFLTAAADNVESENAEELHHPAHLHPTAITEEESNIPKDQQKRFLFKKNPFAYTIGTATHVAIHPLGFKYVLGYGPMTVKYIPKVRSSVTVLKPVWEPTHWRPTLPVPIVKPVLKPIVPVLKPAVVPVVKPVVEPAPTVFHDSLVPVAPAAPAVPVVTAPVRPLPLPSPPATVYQPTPFQPLVTGPPPGVLHDPVGVPQLPFYRPLPPIQPVPLPSLLKPTPAVVPTVQFAPTPAFLPQTTLLASPPPAVIHQPAPVTAWPPAPAPGHILIDHGKTDVQVPAYLPMHPNYHPHLQQQHLQKRVDSEHVNVEEDEDYESSEIDHD